MKPGTNGGGPSLDKPTRGLRERAAARRLKALSLRQAGASFRDIASQLGVSRQQAYRDVDAALSELAELQREKTEKLRALELARLDRLLLAVWPRAQGGDLQAVDRAVRILERISRLMGLDAPTRVSHIGLPASPEIMILGHKVEVDRMPVDELETILMTAARKLGPEVEEAVTARIGFVGGLPVQGGHEPDSPESGGNSEKERQPEAPRDGGPSCHSSAGEIPAASEGSDPG